MAEKNMPALPDIHPHDHPEPRWLKWSQLEIQWIQRYAQQYAEQQRSADLEAMRMAVEIIDQLIACHDEPTCPAIQVGREAIASLRVRVGE